jgi:hypothetical protein
MNTDPRSTDSRAAYPTHTRSTTRGGYAAAFILYVFSAWISPPHASAQASLIVTITSPSSGSIVGGTITVRADVTQLGSLTVAGVQFKVDNVNIGSEDRLAPYSVAWNTATVSNGSHSVTAVARDAVGLQWTSDPVTVTVDNTPPAVSINQAPGQADPTNVSPINFTVAFSEPVSGFGAAGVTITGTAGGTKTVTVTGGPSTYNVAVSGMTNGTVIATIAAFVARDAAQNGNTASTSTDNTVTFSTVATRFENTDPSIAYIDGSTSSGVAPDWWHGSRSREWSGDTASFNRAPGARATFTFTGTWVRWIGFRAPWAGIGRVFLDGAFAGEFDLYSAAELVQATIFTATSLVPGSHTLIVEVTGLKNPSAVDTAVVVDAFDVGPSAPPPIAGTRSQETASSVAYTAGWTQGDRSAAWSGGTAATSTTVAARATFVFTGTSVSWIGLRGPQTGIARVFLDGAFHAQVDTYSPNDFQGIVYTATGLAAASHTLAIEVTGLKNSAAANHLLVVDAFDVGSRFEDVDPSIVYTLSDPGARWVLEHTQKAWSGTSANTGTGTAALSATAGARAEFTFTGTQVTWIGFRGPIAGIADVYLDGGFVATLDLYSPTEALRTAVFTRTGLVAGQHTLRIDVTGRQNPSAGGSYVVVDALDVTLPSPAPPVTRIQQTDPSVVYTSASDWTQSGPDNFDSGGSVAFSVTAAAQAELTFTGTSIRVLGHRRRDSGIVRVYLDGALVGDIDTYAALQDEFQAVLFSRTALTPGEHRVTIVVTGLKNPSSPSAMIVLDAFDVY